MTVDLSPAQAARLAQIEAAPYAEEAFVERVARALWDAVITKWDVENWDEQGEELQAEYRRLAVAAVGVMRGAADDGPISRVLAIAAHLDHVAVNHLDPLHEIADSLRAAVGAPATAEDGTIPWHPCPVCGGDGCDVEAAAAES